MGKIPEAPGLVKDFFDIVEEGPAAAGKMIANVIIPGSGILLSKKVRDELGKAVKPKHKEEESD